MKKLCLLLLIFQSTCVFSQTPLQRFGELDSIITSLVNNKPASAFNYVKEQINIAESLHNDSLLYIATLYQAQLMDQMGMYDETLRILYKLLPRFERHDPYKKAGEIMFDIGNTYFQLRDHKNAYNFYQKCKAAYSKDNRSSDTIRVNFEIGLELTALNRSNEGIALIKQNLEIAKRTGNEDLIIHGLDNLSNCYAEIGDWENSFLYQKQMLAYKGVYENNQTKTAFNQHLAEILIELKRYDEAQAYLSEAIKFATEMQSNDWLFDCYKNQSAIYEAKGNYAQALAYYKKYLATKDSVYKNDYDTKMSTMANLYELDHKQNEIESLAKDKLIASGKIQRLSLSIIALVLVSILIALYILYRKSKAEKHLKEDFASQLLNAQESERQRIAKELHDSVGQNILFIKNQLANPTRNEAQLSKSVDAALEEVRTIAKGLYPNQLEKYGLAAAVEALSEQVRAASGIFVSSDMQGIDGALNKNVQINCYRIIQEFVNNTLKHAEATSIRITTEVSDSAIKLIVQDNGKGFDKSEWERKANRSFGLLNMEERIKMLKGKFEIESEPGKGTKSTFSIPV